MIPAVIERCAGIDVGRRFVVACVKRVYPCRDGEHRVVLETPLQCPGRRKARTHPGQLATGEESTGAQDRPQTVAVSAPGATLNLNPENQDVAVVAPMMRTRIRKKNPRLFPSQELE